MKVLINVVELMTTVWCFYKLEECLCKLENPSFNLLTRIDKLVEKIQVYIKIVRVDFTLFFNLTLTHFLEC